MGVTAAMPIIDRRDTPASPVLARVSQRAIASDEHGLTELRVREVVIHPGRVGRLHVHPTDQVMMVTAGAIQFVTGDDVQTVRAGATLIAPAGEPHKLINNLWVAATLLVIDATNDLNTRYLED